MSGGAFRDSGVFWALNSCANHFFTAFFLINSAGFPWTGVG
jgi:hypothetical protein